MNEGKTTSNILQFKPTDEWVKQAWSSAMWLMKVPLRYHAVPLSMPVPPELTGWQGFENPSEEFPKGRPWCVSFFGAPGTGKTWAAVRLLGHGWGNHARSNDWGVDRRARFIDAGDLVETVRREIATPDDGRSLEIFEKCPCLLLDDAGAERDSDFAKSTVALVLRARYNAQRCTIVTGNAESLKQFGQWMDPRIAERLQEGRVYTLKGTSRRESR